ncbi:hypothetical protein AC579_6483 [Pseudocercospora musae]|uniref:Uncharacterized protein n=1 Tax=Pseudocercospora musae TaxID=113226 RepID=A0A139IAA3_9PEZI|nr:hypothetical protein AC579_6483 [Pseudocercospora musae]
MFSELFIVTTVAVLALQHYIFDNDPYKCQSLIQTGHWLAGEWRPSGCGAVQYGSRSLQTCTRHRKRNIVFAGDLQLEGTYYHFVQRMTTSKNKPVPAPRERDLHHESGSVSLAFLYDPHLNGSLLMNAAEAFRDQTPESPMLLTIGAANTASESASPEEYVDRVRSIASLVHTCRPHRELGSHVDYDTGPGDLLLFAPAEESFHVERSKPFRELNQKLRIASVETPFHLTSAFTRRPVRKITSSQARSWSKRTFFAPAGTCF